MGFSIMLRGSSTVVDKTMKSVKFDRLGIMVGEEDGEHESELGHSSNGLRQVGSWQCHLTFLNGGVLMEFSMQADRYVTPFFWGVYSFGS